MPVTVELSYDGYVLHYVIADPWQISDLLSAYQQERKFRDASDHTLHSLIDFSQARRIPKNWLQARHGPGLNHPTSGVMVCVGLSPGLKVLLEIIFRVTNYKSIKLCATVEEAHAYLAPLVAELRAKADPITPTSDG